MNKKTMDKIVLKLGIIILTFLAGFLTGIMVMKYGYY
jgi:hypothetical protein